MELCGFDLRSWIKWYVLGKGFYLAEGSRIRLGLKLQKTVRKKAFFAEAYFGETKPNPSKLQKKRDFSLEV